MEIDFLGLNSNSSSIQQDSSKDSFPDTWSGGVETSLSLSTSRSFDGQTKNQVRKKEKMINNPSCNDSLSYYSHGSLSRTAHPPLVLASAPVYGPSSSSAALLYYLNRNHCSRNKLEVATSQPGSLKMLYSGDTRISTRGYTPTVAMARRATLARFLEKRLHRMNQARTTHVMGTSVNSEICSSNTSRSSNKRH